MASSVPERFSEIKREIAASQPDFQKNATKAWAEILKELEQRTADIVRDGPNYIPQVAFKDLENLKPDELEKIKRKGCFVIKDIVDDAEARSWKASLEQFVEANPDVHGFPEDNKQFFYLYWTKEQLLARSHPNVLSASAWLNKLYHFSSGDKVEGVDLSVPLSYADRFRIRHPGGPKWERFPPHVDGGSIERWEDPAFRTSFADILSGNWRKHDPYNLDGRLNAKTNIYNRPNQSSIFRTFQGWLALTETGPTQGTLKVFPDVLLSNSYMILRPFFRFVESAESSENPLDPKNWEFDTSSPEFPGIVPRDGGYAGPLPNPAQHPHLRLDETMTSVPKVNPGDMVFWHCDVVHAVEQEHTGTGDSAVMYIPAVPLTAKNAEYIQRQKECFLKGDIPPDYPQGTEASFKGIGTQEDIIGKFGREAMGLPVQVA